MMRLAKLILHYNTPELTQSLCGMVPGAIVIDNGSDKYPYTGPNRCIRQESLGFTRGWNKAVSTLWNEFDSFWLMNSDIRIDQQGVKRVMDTAQHYDFFTPAYNCWMRHCQRKGHGKMEQVQVMEFTAPVISKRVFQRIGMMDERFSMGYGVEFDFCFRAKKAGFKLWVDHGCEFYHLGQQTIMAHGGLLSYSEKANRELFEGLRQKYGPDFRKKVLSGLNIKTNLDMKTCIYTCIFGDYDTLKDIPEQEVGVDKYVITDNPAIQKKGWTTIVPDYPRHDLPPRLRAKYFKMMPWELPELRKYPVSIYIDASIRITSENFVATCLKNLSSDMLLFSHPDRKCIYDEAKASCGLKKYEKEPIEKQVNYYRQFFPAQSGLYACGVLVRRYSERIKQIMVDWWFENIKFSYQDQLSLPVVMKARSFTPSVFKENQYKNSFLKVEWHDDPVKPQSQEKKKHPLISVLMPVWKTPVDTLFKAYDSIMNQSEQDFELVMVDDNNKDKELLKFFKGREILKGERVKVVHTTKNLGLAAALDAGLRHCEGDLVVRMDSDDVAHLDLLKEHKAFFERNPMAHICGVQMNLILPDGRVRNTTSHRPVVTKEIALLPTNFWFTNHPGICYKRETVLALGGYGNTPATMAEDYALWCKFLKAGHLIYNSEKTLMDYTLGDGSQIGQNRKSAEWKEWLEKQKQTLKG